MFFPKTQRHLSSTHVLGLQMREPGLPVCKYKLVQATKRKRDWFSPVPPFFFKQEKPQPECWIVDSNHKAPCWGRAVSAYFHQSKHLSALSSLLLLFVSLCCCLKFRALNKAGRHTQAARGLLSSSKGCQSSHQQILSLGGGHANHSLLKDTHVGPMEETDSFGKLPLNIPLGESIFCNWVVRPA